jgi:hypothetical protein
VCQRAGCALSGASRETRQQQLLCTGLSYYWYGMAGLALRLSWRFRRAAALRVDNSTSMHSGRTSMLSPGLAKLGSSGSKRKREWENGTRMH